MSQYFFFNDTATTEIYTLSLRDALPIWLAEDGWEWDGPPPKRVWRASDQGEFEVLAEFEAATREEAIEWALQRDRKSTRLNSSHANISYAVFCLKKKNYHHGLFLCDHHV